MTNRRTSVYTIRFADPTTDLIEQAAALLPAVSDVGEASVSFRATGDDAALRVTADVMAGLRDDRHPAAASPSLLRPRVCGTPFTLTTGLGVHRREVNTAPLYRETTVEV